MESPDARGRDTGAGYPEEQPEGAQPGAERENPPEAERSDRDGPHGGRGPEGDPGKATGNPHAAG